MASKIRAELEKVAALNDVKGETDAQRMVRLQAAISDDISEEDWVSLSEPAQDWNNAAADCMKAGTAIPAFPDEEPDAETEQAKPSSRRRGAMTDNTQGATGMEVYKPKVGDPVTVTTKRDKVVKGIIVDLTATEVVLNELGDKGEQDDDVDFALSQVASIQLQAPPLGGAGGPEAVEENAASNDPEAGDTVTVTTHRNKVVTGNILELTDEILVLIDPSGSEHEFARTQVKDIKVLVKSKPKQAAAEPAKAPAAGRKRGAAAADAATPASADAEAPTGRRRGSAAAESADEVERTRSPAGVGNRARDLTIENPKWTLEQVEKALTKEGSTWRGATVSMIFKDTQYILKKAGVVK